MLLGLTDTAIMTARCFKGSGITVYGLDSQADNSGFASLLIKSDHMPNTENESEWLAFMLKWLGGFSQKFVLIPTSDEYALLSAKYADQLEKFTYSLLPPLNELQTITERNRQFESVQQCGISVPRFVIGPIDNIEKLFLNFPLAIKPLNSPEWKKIFNIKGFVVKCREELQRSLEIVNQTSARYLVQEIIIGDTRNNYEVNSLYLPNGDYFSHTIRKVHQLPDGFGTATLIETSPNTEVEKLAEKYIRKTNLYGFSNIEFKRDEATGEYFYIETNPRVWLQVNFSAYAGVNFPLMYYSHLTTGKVFSSRSQLRDGKWVDPAPDLLYFIRYRKIKKLKLRNFIRDWCSAKAIGLLSIYDPLPILKEYKFGLRMLGFRKKRRKEEL